jgi:hypothetical protein
VNKNFTFTPNASTQTFIDVPRNLIITVNAIPKWNLNFTCESSWTNTITVTNSTINALLVCDKQDPLNLTVNVTPSANSVITNKILNKSVSFYGTQLNFSLYGEKINALYPQLNKHIVFLPGDANYTLAAANFSASAANITKINATYFGNLYATRYAKGCFNLVFLGNAPLCLQQTANSASINITSICAETALLDHNISEGWGGCIISNWKQSQAQIAFYAKNDSATAQNTTGLKNQIKQLQSNSLPWNSIIIGIVVLLCVGGTLAVYLMRHSKSFRQK